MELKTVRAIFQNLYSSRNLNNSIDRIFVLPAEQFRCWYRKHFYQLSTTSIMKWRVVQPLTYKSEGLNSNEDRNAAVLYMYVFRIKIVLYEQTKKLYLYKFCAFQCLSLSSSDLQIHVKLRRYTINLKQRILISMQESFFQWSSVSYK